MSNPRYNGGDPNHSHFMGGGHPQSHSQSHSHSHSRSHPHGQPPHHSQQQHHGVYTYHSHPPGAGAMANSSSHTHAHAHGHSSAQMHSPATNLMDNINMLDNIHAHRRASYHASSMANHNPTINPHTFAYAQNHHLTHPGAHSHHSLIHHASSSSLSTMSPSMSTAGVPSPNNQRMVGTNHKSIMVHDHDVLSGRGVNIAQHPGNQRFRTLITTFRDQEYCTTYSAGEKRAVALQIIQHIKKLDPPGRFLKRDGRGQGSRGLNGPWDELSEREAIKKTCQALRDCNRQDRQGYAKGVAAPGDVIKAVQESSHISAKDRAAAAALAIATEARTSAFNAISVAASSNSTTLQKAPDSLNETSSTVSMASSNKRCRDPEANSSTTTMSETVESTNMNFSPSSFHNANQLHQPSITNNSMVNRYAQNLNTNYHLPPPQAGFHYQPQQSQPQQQQQQQQHHNSYQPIHPQNHNPQYMSAYNDSNNQNGSYNSATSANSYFHSNSSNHISDYLMPSPNSAQFSFQEGLLPNSTPHGNNGNFHRLQQQDHTLYPFSDPYSENNQHASSLPIPNNSTHEHQVIKKQRTDDTDPSTGPSEPSPLNGNGGGNHSNNASTTVPPNPAPSDYDPIAHDAAMSNNIKHESPEENKKPIPGNDTRIKNEVKDPFFNDDIVDGGENGVDNDVNSWANERINASSIHSNDQFHDALGGL